MTIPRINDARAIANTLANCHPALTAGVVRCAKCGFTKRVDSAKCIRIGWPLCCGRTMTLQG